MDPKSLTVKRGERRKMKCEDVPAVDGNDMHDVLVLSDSDPEHVQTCAECMDKKRTSLGCENSIQI